MRPMAFAFPGLSGRQFLMRPAVRRYRLTRLVAQREGRLEPVTYWMRIGNDVATGVLERQILKVKYGLRGLIPDGALVRISTSASRKKQASRVQDRFIHDFLNSVDQPTLTFLTGDPAKGSARHCDPISGGVGKREGLRELRSFLDAIVNVLDTHDIVFAEIGAGLNLDQLEVDLAGIGEAMNDANRQKDQLVLVHDGLFLAARDLGGAVDHDPMFGAMEMPLQREPAARGHNDAFDLVARPVVDRLIIAPRPINPLVLGRLAPPAFLQARDELLDLVALVPTEYEHRVLRGDDDDILHADDGGEQPGGANVHIIGIQRDALAVK